VLDCASLKICKKKIQLDATQRFIELIIRSTCLAHYFAHHQELETIQVITACGTWYFVESWSCGLEWDGGQKSTLMLIDNKIKIPHCAV